MKLNTLRLLFGFCFFFCIGAFLLGFIVAEKKTRGYFRISSLMTKVENVVAKPEVVNDKVITSIFTDLISKSISIPVNRSGDGGAITSFGSEVILMTHEGRVFLVDENGYSETKVLLPDNAFDEYFEASLTDKYKDMTHNYDWFRYNDILFYSENNHKYLVVSYTKWVEEEECYGTAISTVELPADADSLLDVEVEPEDWHMAYQTQPCLKLKSKYRAIEGHMAGGRIAYFGNNKIILGSGDYHWDGVYAPEALPQLLDNDYGKVLEIDLNSGLSSKLSLGNRNTQGVLVDGDGQIWVTEHGVRGGDELNLIKEGSNYGWPNETLGVGYNLLPWPMTTDEGYGRHETYSLPIYSWVPSVGVSGIAEISNFHPAWDGDFLVATLSAHNLYRVRVRDGRVLFSEPIVIGERIRYVHQHTNGQIVLWTDNKTIEFISPIDSKSIVAQLESFAEEKEMDGGKTEKFLELTNKCMECHAFNNYDSQKAPALGSIYNRDIASTDYMNYSQALLSKRGRWTKENLEEFIKAPQLFAPGTHMPDQSLTDHEDLESIIQFLEKVSTPE